jgi:hypothetical protein
MVYKEQAENFALDKEVHSTYNTYLKQAEAPVTEPQSDKTQSKPEATSDQKRRKLNDTVTSLIHIADWKSSTGEEKKPFIFLESSEGYVTVKETVED